MSKIYWDLEKKALILLPIIINDEYKPYEEDEKFKKVIDIIDIISTTDDNIIQKANFTKISKNTILTPKRNQKEVDYKLLEEVLPTGLQLSYNKFKMDMSFYFCLYID